MFLSNTEKTIQKYDTSNKNRNYNNIFKCNCINIGIGLNSTIKINIFSLRFTNWPNGCIFLLYFILYSIRAQDS